MVPSEGRRAALAQRCWRLDEAYGCETDGVYGHKSDPMRSSAAVVCPAHPLSVPSVRGE